MVEANKKEYDFCNIPQWTTFLMDAPKIKFANLEEDIHQEWHGLKVEKVMLEDLTNVEEFTVSYCKWSSANIEKFIDDCIANGVNLIISSLLLKASLSTEIEKYTRAFKKARENNIFIINALGNDSQDADTTANICKIENVIGISAVHLDEQKNIAKLASYTNRGMLTNDYADFSNIEIDKEMLTGTSFSQPFFSKKLILIMKYFLKMGREFTYDNIINFIDSNLKDLGDIGQDAKFGKGILVLPNVYDLAVIDGTIIGKIGSTEIKKGNKAIQMDVAPFIKDGRTFVPIRFIAEALGKKVEWNNDTQEFTIKGM